MCLLTYDKYYGNCRDSKTDEGVEGDGKDFDDSFLEFGIGRLLTFLLGRGLFFRVLRRSSSSGFFEVPIFRVLFFR